MNKTMYKACETLYKMIGQDKIMVLATRNGQGVAARTINVYSYKGDFYFITECNSKKYMQLKENPNAALAVDAIQISGIAEFLEHPSSQSNAAFVKAIESLLTKQFDKYAQDEEMRLVKISPMCSSFISLESGEGFFIDFKTGNAENISHAM